LRVAAVASDWSAWGSALAAMAENYSRAGDEARAEGRTASAAEQWRRAVDYFHFAQVKLTDEAEKSACQARVRLNYEKLAGLLSPRAVPLLIPFKGAFMRGYFRMAEAGAPCVVLIGGLDSAKEVELHYFAEGFLKRGLSVFYFDGPGQGESVGQLNLDAHFEEAVTVVLDFLSDHVKVDGFGLFGVSFGGYLACRSAAAEPRVKACVSLGGFFDSRILQRLPLPAFANLRRAFGLNENEEVERMASQITLEPLRGRMDRPLFIIHGRDDHLVDEAQVEAMSAWAGGLNEVWMMEGAEHVCTNRFGECLPVLCDWMRAQLTMAVAPQLIPSESEGLSWHANS
ncbi:MAG: alpha/beta fold hydrolase, partial [Acidobacteria bacterium]|nr:alpha/beta fold hydrolase [Acidobacteriota bacterium]